MLRPSPSVSCRLPPHDPTACTVECSGMSHRSARLYRWRNMPCLDWSIRLFTRFSSTAGSTSADKFKTPGGRSFDKSWSTIGVGALFDGPAGPMDTYAAHRGHRAKSSRLTLVSNIAALDDPPRDSEIRSLSPRVSLALILLSSLGLWAVVWFALTCLISNWP